MTDGIIQCMNVYMIYILVKVALTSKFKCYRLSYNIDVVTLIALIYQLYDMIQYSSEIC